MTQRELSLLDRITMNPGILSGKPTIQGTRMPVWIIIESIDLGQTNEEIVDDYPFLMLEDVEVVRFYIDIPREVVRLGSFASQLSLLPRTDYFRESAECLLSIA